ncbi:TIGR02530 family flagellar biosynthesis protein [Bacillus massilinigeriensis]|uniref:TIGR02530 family flagellar biosynthesis protein n=1 Tax=Bacillus mediterraneensis TaxID=1805474 RepID=UPI0008F812E2|nr:TIGR02530 family flagellar biosynthesis protein [Bacillus mediterraneensis]
MDSIIYRPLHPYPARDLRKNIVQEKSTTPSFSEKLKEELGQVKKLELSKHAEQRLIQRGISIPSDQWHSIEAKISQAREMGINDSLVLLKEAALIVSVKNSIVITAIDRKEVDGHIFSNIDGTIMLDS